MTSPSYFTDLSVQGESLQKLYSEFIRGRFNVNRKYQRKLVWDLMRSDSSSTAYVRRCPSR